MFAAHYGTSIMRINRGKYNKMSWKVQYFRNSVCVCIYKVRILDI